MKTLSSTDPVVVKKFSEEANLMKTFSHPNIISLLGKTKVSVSLLTFVTQRTS